MWNCDKMYFFTHVTLISWRLILTLTIVKVHLRALPACLHCNFEKTTQGLMVYEPEVCAPEEATEQLEKTCGGLVSVLLKRLN